MQVEKQTFKFLLMSIFNKLVVLLGLAGLPYVAIGQSCHLKLSGYVIDVGTQDALPDAMLSIEELNRTTFADVQGGFSFINVCAGEYHLVVTHIGCSPQRFYINLKNDTTLNIALNHNHELIREVLIKGEMYRPIETQTSSTIEKDEITANSGKNLTQNIDEIAGVSSLSNGAGIAKPVIQGMWGNRVSIINYGIAQSGQQWGVDHAPEIDPFVADHITVIKGANALAYGGVSLGGVVKIEPATIAQDPHIHGLVNYNVMTNGLGQTLNAQLEQGKKWGSWRITGTLKLIGDRRSPNYYLTNTGNREANFSALFQKDFSRRFIASFYYSQFNTEIGILRGSHVSNSTDLALAINRNEPFFTNDFFSYEIAAPRQRISHHLLKAEAKYLLNDEQMLTWRYGGQLNNRNEFDVRRSGRSEQPALSIAQNTQFVEGIYTFPLGDVGLTTGIQYNFVDNTNDNANTGRMPLIPDYRANQTSAFAIGTYNYTRWFFEFGGRFDYKDLEVLTITETLPREIERKFHQFSNYSLSAGVHYETGPFMDIKLDVGLVQRQPEVNEMYSSGLHQGLASVEYGNPNLIAEQSFKAVLDFDIKLDDNWFIQVLGYYHSIDNYIYLMPTGTFEVNISGSFPVFEYNQTDARLLGSDILVSRTLGTHWKATLVASILRGDDLKNSEALIFMPANNVLARLAYSLADGKKWRNKTIELNGKFVARQNHYNENQDFLPPPDGYFLLGLQAGTNVHFSHSSLLLNLRIDNALNTVYRDYLNRQRYFADDLGINISLRVGYNF
jgi:iron complex outermembrane receptor protein